MERPRLAVLIPAFNESKTIGNVVKEAISYCDVYVVDDNSNDNTAKEAILNGAKVIHNQGLNGYENALSYGFSSVRKLDYDYIITLDADGQHDPKYIQNFIDIIFSSSPSIIIAERTVLPRLSEIFFSKFTSYFYNIGDAFSGFKSYKVKDYKGYEFGMYKLTGLNFLNLCIVRNKMYQTFSITINDRLDQPRFGTTFKANMRLIRSILTFLFFMIYRR